MNIRYNKEYRSKPISYTYIWYMIKNNEHIPFYVGKGKGTRYTAKEHFNNIEFKRIYEKYECYHKFEIKNVSDYIAIEKEIELIEKIGRRDKGEGPLINHTRGGDGIVGRIFTEEQLMKQREHLKRISNDHIIQARRKNNVKIAIQKPEHKIKLSNIMKTNFANNPEYYNKIAEHNKTMWQNSELREKASKSQKERFANPEEREKLSKAIREATTDELREKRSQITTERYKNPEERKKTAEATKAAMANLPEEKLSRTHLSELPNETLIQMTKERYLTREEMAKKFNTSVANAKNIKEETHWIYRYMEKHNIPIIKFPKKKKFRSSVSADILLQIVKDKEMSIPELYKKYNISKKILTNVKSGQSWIYEYIELNNINLDDIK